VPAEQWVACSAGQGAKGRRLCDWTRVELAASTTVGMARWLLVRRSRRDGELAVARARAASEQASETAKHYSIARMAPSLSSRS
jgi:hypothetical protein